jgi:hypothetical protein
MKMLCAVAACAFLLSSAAGADTKRIVDTPAHDSQSDFDIEWIKHGHDDRKLVHVISTYRRWQTSELGENLFQINISPGDGAPSVRRILVIWLDGSELKAKMMDVSNGSEVVGYPLVSRPTARSVKVTMPKRYIRRGLHAYRWQAFVADQQVDDMVPSNEGFILHRVN